MLKMVIILMMEAARTSESLVNFYQTTRRYNPEDSHLCTHRRENLKSDLNNVFLKGLFIFIGDSDFEVVLYNSSLNVFDDGAVLLLFKFWTFSVISLFLNHYVSRDGSSLQSRCT
jgi:hypothetical protein